ncbi:hypothetical protein ACPDIX_05955 [Limisphaera sp. 4302-co]
MQTLAFVAALTLPWILLQAADGGGSGSSTETCKVDDTQTGCENQGANCTTQYGNAGTCQGVNNPSKPCKCDPVQMPKY